MTADGSWHAASSMFYRNRAEPEVASRVAADIRHEAPSLSFTHEVLSEDGRPSHVARANGRPVA